jgi:hypothetical protein
VIYSYYDDDSGVDVDSDDDDDDDDGVGSSSLMQFISIIYHTQIEVIFEAILQLH